MPKPSTPSPIDPHSIEEPGLPKKRVRVNVAALSDRGHVRESNEDAYVVFRIGRYLERVDSNVPESELPSRYEEAGHVMVVADGLGGHEAGDVASRTALVTTLRLILRAPRWALRLDDPTTREAEIRGLLARSKTYLASIHAALREQASTDARLAGMGTTLTGAYSVGADLFVLHVGDSKAYLLRGGALAKITHDHTVAQEYADRGIISQEEVPSHHMHHVLTRAVGGPEETLEGDMHHLRVAHGDRLLLCSDGLTDLVTEDEIAAILRSFPADEAACRSLVDLTLERGGRDNVTVIVASFAMG
ncbi:MAG: serine/threonine-protein phosphatase [Candidatus Eisenbacteria bacterium]|uniref:Serine/threonine-protein phosphatase n=1 Tax=Eiseniibacteriota bacterium TaxID=2212470 RepID=A0A538TXB3_UNCEI|nr:MAG: serine/threonine-protein phosphatase [Candidatus Eisenbacteria bacterium]